MCVYLVRALNIMIFTISTVCCVIVMGASRSLLLMFGGGGGVLFCCVAVVFFFCYSPVRFDLSYSYYIET